MELVEHPREHIPIQYIDGERLLLDAISLHPHLVICFIDGEVIRCSNQLIGPWLPTAELVLEAPIAWRKEHHHEGGEEQRDEGLEPQALEDSLEGYLIHCL